MEKTTLIHSFVVFPTEQMEKSFFVTENGVILEKSLLFLICINYNLDY